MVKTHQIYIILTIVLVAFCVEVHFIKYNSNISPKLYNVVTQQYKDFPRARPIIMSALEDEKITLLEYIDIQEEVNKIKITKTILGIKEIIR